MMTFEQAWPIIDAVTGYLSRAESEIIFNAARAVSVSIPTAVSVEIGSYQGRSAIAMALGAGENASVFCVEPHTPMQGMLGGSFGPQDRQKFYENLVRAKVGHIVRLISLASKDAVAAFRGRKIGLLFIDGDHSMQAVYSDLFHWRDKLHNDAMVLCHDANLSSVETAVTMLSRGPEAIMPLYNNMGKRGNLYVLESAESL